MRILVINVCILMVAIAVIQGLTVGGSVTYPPEPVTANYGNFWDYVETGIDPADPSATKCKNRENFLNLMKKRFDLSLKYLLTSKQFGSQFVQRPGLAKYLDESSTRQWEEGMDILKKFLQRGGSINNQEFRNAMKVEGAGQLTLAKEEKLVEKYIENLDGMRTDSIGLVSDMNYLHHVAGKVFRRGGDAEIAHYFDGKLEKEAEITRELARYVNNLGLMSSSGIAVNMFDSNF